MKIVVTTSTFPVSPSDTVPRFVEDQIKEMVKLDTGLDVHVHTAHHSYCNPLEDKIERESHTEHRYHYVYPRRLEKLSGRAILPTLRRNPLYFFLIPNYMWFQYRSLLKLCRSERPDLLYAHWFMTQAITSYFVSKQLGIPLVFTTHASDVSVLKKIPLSKYFVAKVLSHSQAYTAVSRRTAAKLEAAVEPELWEKHFRKKLDILPMGTYIKPLTTSKKERLETLKQAEITNDKKIIFCIGRISQKKGFRYLIDAFSQLDEKQRNIYELVIAGDGELLQDHKAQVKRLNLNKEVVFTGYVQGELKEALFAEADIFILPSIIEGGDSEGLPVTLMEALSAKKIVIATNVSGAEEIIDESSGYLVEQKSSKEIYKAIQSIIAMNKTERNAMIRAGSKQSKQFDWRLIAEKHLNLLRKAAELHD